MIVGAVVNKLTGNKVAAAAAMGMTLALTKGGNVAERKGVNETNSASSASEIKTSTSNLVGYHGGDVHKDEVIVSTTEDPHTKQYTKKKYEGDY